MRRENVPWPISFVLSDLCTGGGRVKAGDAQEL